MICILTGFVSVSSSSSSNNDGTGHTFTVTNNDGHETYTYKQNKPGGGTVTRLGEFPVDDQQGTFYDSANLGQQSGFGVSYSPGKSNRLLSFFEYLSSLLNICDSTKADFSYDPYGFQQQVFTPYAQSFGINARFQPFQPLSPIQPFAPFQSPLATPQDFNQYLNSLQQQYAVCVLFVMYST